MDYSLKCEKREYIRINTDIPAVFKFLGDEKNFPDMGKRFDGRVASVGGGGVALEGPLSDRAWISRFILQKIIIGVELTLPGSDSPIAALCRVAWIEDADKKSEGKDLFRYGLVFREISTGDRDRIFDFVIHSYMKG